MYQKGEYIHYSTNGLCRVDDITTLEMDGADKDLLYYRLTPLEGKGGTIYAPVDSDKVVMRRALTRDEADSLINAMPGISAMTIPEDRNREKSYRQAIASADCRQWTALIKALYQRRKTRQEMGKKVTATEEKYYNSVCQLLYSELGLALGIEPASMEEYITDRLGQ